MANLSRNLARLVASLALVFAVAAIGGWVTAGSVESWYPTLVKPGLNPPNWVFAPVWTLLYVLMGFAAWRVWIKRGTLADPAFVLYGVQLVLNLLWSVLFFGLHAPGAALIELALLMAAILATYSAFRRADGIAAACLVPYIAWVGFAGVLNASVWWLN